MVNSFSLSKIKHLLINRHFYGWTSPIRVLPDLIVIGVGRGGTTSLYHYLDQHKCISKSAYDEIGYFDDNYNLGINWYRSMFPTIFHKKKIISKYGKFLTYEVTPWYIRRPWIIERIHDILPTVKIIAVLRNPVDRTYSHYHMAKRNQIISNSFDKIIDSDINFLNNSKNIQNFNNEYYKEIVQNSFLARGFYAEQLENWFKVFPREQILIISSEELAENTQSTLDLIFKFLNLKPQKIPNLKKMNVAKYPPMSVKTRNKLNKFFQNYNENLFELVGKRFSWEN